MKRYTPLIVLLIGANCLLLVLLVLVLSIERGSPLSDQLAATLKPLVASNPINAKERESRRLVEAMWRKDRGDGVELPYISEVLEYAPASQFEVYESRLFEPYPMPGINEWITLTNHPRAMLVVVKSTPPANEANAYRAFWKSDPPATLHIYAFEGKECIGSYDRYRRRRS